MNERGNQVVARAQEAARDERGQSIVLIALMIVGLVAFAGLAVDVGFLFARNSQFSGSADAAALAGVVELHRADGLNLAIDRADQFLDANNWSANQVSGSESLTDRGIPQFTFTATWYVNTFFLSLLGFEDIAITKSATAAYYASTDIPLATATDQGIIRTASPFVFGVDACTSLGDAISPRMATGTMPNVLYALNEGTYTYRIAVPVDYLTDTGQSLVHVQLFDPDPYNNPAADFSTYEKVDGTVVNGAGLSCNSGSGGIGEACVAATGDMNPFWFFRVDESYTASTCPIAATGNNLGNVVTRYALYYLDDEQERHDLTSYTSNNATLTDTDMKWVTPGAEGGRVPTDDGGSFVVDLNTIPLDEENEIYSFYMAVTGEAGTSKNVWDVWAGPPEMALGYSDDVNQRNLEIFRRTITTTNPSRIYARGYMAPHIYQVSGDVELPVAAIDPTLAGGGAYVSAFDMDNGAAGASSSGLLEFTIDTVAEEDFIIPWALNCGGSASCDNAWINPQVEMGIPSQETGVAFYGGDMLVTYRPSGDDHTWSVAVTRGRPFLTR